METWQTCTCCIQHGVVRKHKRWQGAAHFTRRSKLGPAVCDFTRNRRTQYAKYALSCDPKFTNQRLLGWMLMILQSAYVFFLKKLMGYHYNIILNAICSSRKIAVDKIWGEECLQKGDTLYYNCFGVKPAFCIRTSKLTLLHATSFYSTTHSSFVTVCIGACVNIHGPMKGWLLWS